MQADQLEMVRGARTLHRALRQSVRQLDLVERVEDQMADARLEGVPELGLGLVIAMQVDAGRVEASGERDMQLPAGGDVDREALLAHHPERGGGGEGLARVDDLEGLGALLEGTYV